MEKNVKNYVLEPSTNTHQIKGNIKSVKEVDDVIVMEIEGNGVVLHGEHGTISTEHPVVVKYNQVELNPITKKYQKAFD